VKLLVDMNLSPRWVAAIRSVGLEAIHWSSVGSPTATDREVIAWAVANDACLLTHDLDFGAILAASGAHKPSVLQLRSQDVTPDLMAAKVAELVRRFAPELTEGALLSLEPERARIRLLPLKPRSDPTPPD
jgi:predicted nuclease of predicted toxin-antitoxin system